MTLVFRPWTTNLYANEETNQLRSPIEFSFYISLSGNKNGGFDAYRWFIEVCWISLSIIQQPQNFRPFWEVLEPSGVVFSSLPIGQLVCRVPTCNPKMIEARKVLMLWKKYLKASVYTGSWSKLGTPICRVRHEKILNDQFNCGFGGLQIWQEPHLPSLIPDCNYNLSIVVPLYEK